MISGISDYKGGLLYSQAHYDLEMILDKEVCTRLFTIEQLEVCLCAAKKINARQEETRGLDAQRYHAWVRFIQVELERKRAL